MGLDYSAVTVIGVSFSMPDRLIQTVTQDSCEHPEREGHAFCPVCGTKVTTKTRTYYDDIFEATEAIEKALPKGYILQSIEEETEYLIGFGMSVDRHDQSLHQHAALPDREEIEDTIQRVLVKAGIEEVLDEKAAFGLHCVMDIR